MAHSPSQAAQSKLFSCVICNSQIDEDHDAVECDNCKEWTHSRCSGIPKGVYKQLSNCSNLLFRCNHCKSHPGPVQNTAPSLHDFTQLFNTVQSLATSVKTLHDDISLIKPLIQEIHTLRREVDNINTSLNQLPNHQLPSHTDLQETIREEVLECREREKRLNSVIIRGVMCDSAELQTKFNDIVDHLLPGNTIPLRDIIPIKPGLARAKIMDMTQRRNLLSAAGNLRQSPFPNVYITRDLTYKQREAKKKLRQSVVRGANRSAGPTTSPNTQPARPPALPTPLSPAPHTVTPTIQPSARPIVSNVPPTNNSKN